MSGSELRAVIADLGLNQGEAAAFLGVYLRTMQRWCASDVVDDSGKAKGHEIPVGYAMLLRYMVAKKLSPEDVASAAAVTVR
jgi:hypothetical protein